MNFIVSKQLLVIVLLRNIRIYYFYFFYDLKENI